MGRLYFRTDGVTFLYSRRNSVARETVRESHSQVSRERSISLTPLVYGLTTVRLYPLLTRAVSVSMTRPWQDPGMWEESTKLSLSSPVCVYLCTCMYRDVCTTMFPAHFKRRFALPTRAHDRENFSLVNHSPSSRVALCHTTQSNTNPTQVQHISPTQFQHKSRVFSRHSEISAHSRV